MYACARSLSIASSNMPVLPEPVGAETTCRPQLAACVEGTAGVPDCHCAYHLSHGAHVLVDKDRVFTGKARISSLRARTILPFSA